MKKIGFIGAGVMAHGMIDNLQSANYEISVYTRTKAKAEDLIERGAR